MEGVEQFLADTKRDVAMLIYDQEQIVDQVDFLTEEWRRLSNEVARLTTDLNHLALAWFDQEAEYQHMWGQVDMLTLGTGAQIPTGYMVKTLRAQSTCDSNMPSDQMLSTF